MPQRPSLRFAYLLAAATSGALACNAITGADDLVIEGVDGPSGNGGTTNSVGVGPGNGSTSSGVDPTPMVGAAGVTIREVSLYQGVKRPLMQSGAPVASNIPVVFGRDALIRVFYDTDASYNGRPIKARLHLEGHPTIEVESTLFPSSTDANLESTINFNVTADVVLGTMAYRVELLQPPAESTDNPAAKYPATGFDPIPVDPSPAVVRVELVPVAYGADGSNRVPDTSPEQVKRYQDLFYAMYPTTSVDITVHEALPWSSAIEPFGGGWGELLDALAAYRQQAGAPSNVYYYGIFQPQQSAGQYCSQGCVLGLGYLPSPGDTFQRVAIGVGYPEQNLDIETAVHEIGHAHGRPHAPCGGADGPDPAFPHANGSIGVWGYNILTQQLYDPAGYADVMGYCLPMWISDHNFRELLSRVQFVDGAKIDYPPELLDRTYERARVTPAGQVVFLDPIQIHEPPMAEPIPIDLVTASGVEQITGQILRYDHLEGGLLLWPQTSSPVSALTAHLDGGAVQGTR